MCRAVLHLSRVVDHAALSLRMTFAWPAPSRNSPMSLSLSDVFTSSCLSYRTSKKQTNKASWEIHSHTKTNTLLEYEDISQHNQKANTLQARNQTPVALLNTSNTSLSLKHPTPVPAQSANAYQSLLLCEATERYVHSSQHCDFPRDTFTATSTQLRKCLDGTSIE